jgi:hypothetical protein
MIFVQFMYQNDNSNLEAIRNLTKKKCFLNIKTGKSNIGIVIALM